MEHLVQSCKYKWRKQTRNSEEHLTDKQKCKRYNLAVFIPLPSIKLNGDLRLRFAGTLLSPNIVVPFRYCVIKKTPQ